MATWAPNTTQVIDNGYGGSRNGSPINGFVIHHGAGLKVLRYVAGYNDRNSHPTYHVDAFGNLTGIVHPDRRPASTGHSVDQEAVTVELDNSSVGGVGDDAWPISDATMETLLQTILYHESQSARKGFAKNTPGYNQSEFFIAWHSQYVSTACPGPYITSRLDWIVAELNRRKAGDYTPPASSVPAPAPAASAASSPPSSSTVGPILRSGGDWAIRLPTGDLAKYVVRGLQSKGRLSANYPNDGDPQRVFEAAVQKTLNFSNVFHGLEDGRLERGGAYGIQDYAIRFGDYTQDGGIRDGRPEGISWRCFGLGVTRP
ncbi:N-acetylmuramoyl-L-alanine amidase [Cryobacterium sp. Y62]|uniref:N-acetylmuramoyl-L-alanine amidase n=1 Tax=Cryobacterium sp. Y62 TaxID=2048284 RepID=UPI000CE3C3F5|nr:N-acetylmuramoyl-L-alanine amidase [Cryobacterium sp. Y62]